MNCDYTDTKPVISNKTTTYSSKNRNYIHKNQESTQNTDKKVKLITLNHYYFYYTLYYNHVNSLTLHKPNIVVITFNFSVSDNSPYVNLNIQQCRHHTLSMFNKCTLSQTDLFSTLLVVNNKVIISPNLSFTLIINGIKYLIFFIFNG